MFIITKIGKKALVICFTLALIGMAFSPLISEFIFVNKTEYETDPRIIAALDTLDLEIKRRSEVLERFSTIVALDGDTPRYIAEHNRENFHESLLLFLNAYDFDTLMAIDSMITAAVLISGGNFEQLAFHLNLAKQNGATKTEIAEAITHLAFYAGWPRAWSAFNLEKSYQEERTGDDELAVLM